MPARARLVLSVVAAAALAPRVVGADPAPPVSYRIEVERATDARECPDERGLAERLQRLLGPEVVREATGDPDTIVRVHISRKGPDYVGTIRASGLRAGERTLTSRAPSQGAAAGRCDAFAQAVALSIAILLDPDPVPPDPKPEPAARPEPPPRKRPPPPPVGAPAAPEPKEPGFPRWGVELWGFESGAILSTGAFGGGALLDARVTRLFSVGLGLLYFPYDKVQFGAGSLELSLVTGLLEVCLTPFEVKRFRAFGCASGTLGVLNGRGSGYDTDHAASLLWGTLGGTLGAEAQLVGPLSLASRVTVLAPLESKAFVVVPGGPDAGPTGDAFRTKPVGVVAGFGLRVTVP